MGPGRAGQPVATCVPVSSAPGTLTRAVAWRSGRLRWKSRHDTRSRVTPSPSWAVPRHLWPQELPGKARAGCGQGDSGGWGGAPQLPLLSMRGAWGARCRRGCTVTGGTDSCHFLLTGPLCPLRRPPHPEGPSPLSAWPPTP